VLAVLLSASSLAAAQEQALKTRGYALRAEAEDEAMKMSALVRPPVGVLLLPLSGTAGRRRRQLWVVRLLAPGVPWWRSSPSLWLCLAAWHYQPVPCHRPSSTAGSAACSKLSTRLPCPLPAHPPARQPCPTRLMQPQSPGQRRSLCAKWMLEFKKSYASPQEVLTDRVQGQHLAESVACAGRGRAGAGRQGSMWPPTQPQPPGPLVYPYDRQE